MKRFLQWITTIVNPRTFMFYALGGVASYIINLGVTFLLVEVLHLYYVLSYSIALVFSTLFNFFVNSKVIFKASDNTTRRLVGYVASVIGFAALSVLVVKWLTDGFNMHYAIAITLTTGVIFLVKFFWYDRYIFKARKQ